MIVTICIVMRCNVTNATNIHLAVNTISLIVKGLNLGKIAQSQSVQTIQEFAFKIIIKTHQSLYPVNKDPVQAHVFRDGDGIKRAMVRMDSSSGPSLVVSDIPYIVSRHDTRLIFLLIQKAHASLSQKGILVHLGTSVTAANLIKPPFPVWLNNSEKLCAIHVQKCPLCRYLHSQPRHGTRCRQ